MQSLHSLSENTTVNSSQQQFTESPIEKNVKALMSYLNELRSNKKENLTMQEHEQIIIRLTNHIGQAAMTEVLETYDVNNDMISVGEQTYRRKHKAPKLYQSAFGTMTVERHVYANRKKDGDGRCICPLEMQAGLIGGYWTPLAAKNAAWCLAHVTPQEAEDLLLQFGQMNPSRSSLDRLPKILEQKWAPQQAKALEKIIEKEDVPENAVTMATSLDGVMVAMKPKNSPENKGKNKACEWKEASCGTISFFDADGERLSTLQYARMPECKKATLKQCLQQNVEANIKKRPDLNIVHIADGAQDNWTFFDEQMPHGFQLTDFYHACQYLKDAFNAAYPKDPDKANEKFSEYRHTLRHDREGIKKLLRALRYLRDKQPTSTLIQTALTYFTNNQHRMKYAEAKEKNFPIGSGIVEAACKSLVGQRLKRSGMSWHFEGGQAILNLRALIKSHRFDCAWEMISEKFRTTVNPLANVITLYD